MINLMFLLLNLLYIFKVVCRSSWCNTVKYDARMRGKMQWLGLNFQTAREMAIREIWWSLSWLGKASKASQHNSCVQCGCRGFSLCNSIKTAVRGSLTEWNVTRHEDDFNIAQAAERISHKVMPQINRSLSYRVNLLSIIYSYRIWHCKYKNRRYGGFFMFVGYSLCSVHNDVKICSLFIADYI